MFVLSHHRVMNASPDDRSIRVRESLLVFLSNGVHNQILLKAYSDNLCPRPQLVVVQCSFFVAMAKWLTALV